MVYTERNQLTIVELDRDENNLSIDSLKEILAKRPSNTIYCEIEGKLKGIVSVGDISRAYMRGMNKVPINSKFTFVYKGEYVKARSIFEQKKNINTIPIITEDMLLIGDYVRWNDLIEMKYELEMEGGSKSVYITNDKKIALVRPNSIFIKRKKVYEILKSYLYEQDIFTVSTEYSEISQLLDIVDMVLFVDENEIQGCRIFLLLSDMLSKAESKLKTYKQIFSNNSTCIDAGQGIQYIEELCNKGVHVLGLTCESYKSEYIDSLYEDIKRKFATVGENPSHTLHQFMYSDFFDDLYSEEYAKKILEIPFGNQNIGGIVRLKDYSSQYYNVINGERLTVSQPKKYRKSIYFFGACYIRGHYVEDKNTIESILQERISENRVVNCGSVFQRWGASLARAAITRFKRGDILVFDRIPMGIEGVEYLELHRILEKNKVDAKWIIDGPMHCNHKVNKLYADAIYEVIKPMLCEKIVNQGEWIEQESDYIKFLYIDRYFAEFNASKYEKIGSIVMNCNPFTYGHRYLIEQALKAIDFLIIFVVEEDKSYFSFYERFAMVRQGVADLKNITVVPSGPFILSQMSFPEYFIKETSDDIVEHTEQDITTFAERIAPQLGIKYRFVGEEPEDNVTNQYNLAMKKILPQYGMKLVEIPRKRINGNYISASSVRRYMEENDRDGQERLLPKSTKRLLGI